MKINSIVSLYLLEGIKSVDNDPLMTPFESHFTTEMSPMYTSAAEIRRIVGVHVPSIPDSIMNQLIHTYSLLAADLASCHRDDKWERFAGQWVAIKVALTVIANTDAFVVAGEGKVFKQLGDLSISRGEGMSVEAGLSRLMNSLECELFKYEHAVRNCLQPLVDCLGLTDLNARPYVPKLAELVDKGANDFNKPLGGRRWKTNLAGDTSGESRVVHFGKIYGVNRRR